METYCVNIFKGAGISEEDEEVIVDYLSDHQIDVNLDTSLLEMCEMAITHKLGSKKEFLKYVEKLNVEKEIENEQYLPYKYGDLNINSYLEVALHTDDRTLLNMMHVSDLHHKKFDDQFFKKYLEKNYPNLVQYRPPGKSYNSYYLSVIYSIAQLKEKYNFEYLPSESYDVINTLKYTNLLMKSAPTFT